MIVILTGAGISQESGIPVFRGPGGLWEGRRVEDVATPEAFAREPGLVHSFYNARRRHLLSGKVAPNPAHFALARLEKEAKEEMLLVTQNVDNLHERGGSQNILHMHGEMLKARCSRCDFITPWETDMSVESECPACGKAGGVRPHIVWFGEMPLYMDEIERALSHCRLFVSIGTSGTVYPAAGFAALAKRRGARTLELNLEPSAAGNAFDDGVYGKASEIVPAWVEDMVK